MADTAKRLVRLTGLDGISAVLQGLPKDVRTQILAAAVKDAAKPMVVAAKRFAKRSERTGALREAIGAIVRKYPNSAAAVAIVGVVRGYYRGRKKLGAGADRGGSESPSHYAHLVEFGHHVRAPIRGTSIRKGTAVPARAGKKTWVPPKPFLRPAFLTTALTVKAALARGIDSGIEKTRSRLIRQNLHAA